MTEVPDVRPGALVRLASDWRAKLWPVRGGGWPGPRDAPWTRRWIDGPCTMLVLARLADEQGFDDLLVCTAQGVSGWTYLDPTAQGRLTIVCRARAAGATNGP